MTDIQQLKRFSIRDYLSRRGIQPARENSRCGFYLSPFRPEHTPSFKVDYVQNLWYDFGSGNGGSTASAIHVPAIPTVPALRILSDAPLHNAALVAYLQSRTIDPATASAYCREVRYAVERREFFAVGFRNDAGGWELRSERFKGGSSPKHITTIDNHADTCIAFEGFMDFLSYLSLKPAERLCIDVGGGC